MRDNNPFGPAPGADAVLMCRLPLLESSPHRGAREIRDYLLTALYRGQRLDAPDLQAVLKTVLPMLSGGTMTPARFMAKGDKGRGDFEINREKLGETFSKADQVMYEHFGSFDAVVKTAIERRARVICEDDAMYRRVLTAAKAVSVLLLRREDLRTIFADKALWRVESHEIADAEICRGPEYWYYLAATA